MAAVKIACRGYVYCFSVMLVATPILDGDGGG